MIQKNELRECVNNGWKFKDKLSSPSNISISEDSNLDFSTYLEEFNKDKIAKLITQKLKDQKIKFLIESILKSRGDFTYYSPVGVDKGINLLVEPPPMGLSQLRLCVQVK